MSVTKPDLVTGTEPEASDKDRGNSSVTDGAGQATPRCQATTSIKQPIHVKLSCNRERGQRLHDSLMALIK